MPARLIVVAIGGLLVGTFVGAVVLRAAIALYNKLAGGERSANSVPEPSFDKAMITTFVMSLVGFVGGIAFQIISGGAAQATRSHKYSYYDLKSGWTGGLNFNVQLISLPVGLLAMAMTLSRVLPTTFVRAIRVTLCYLVVAIVFGGLIGGIAAFMVSRLLT